jgi:hypothetical protein
MREQQSAETAQRMGGDWPTCWCSLSGPEYGHLWDRLRCPRPHEPMEAGESRA